MDFIKAKAIAVTQPVVDYIPDSEGIISYSARVSNPSNQTNFDTANKLLGFCAREKHWSVFTMANVVMEVQVPRDIARQMLRHQSFDPQERSQRYMAIEDFVIREARLQDKKNRQNSIETDDTEIQDWWKEAQEQVIALVKERYQEALDRGIAKEQARVILPEGNTMSHMYMNGNIRSWIHYCQVRRHEASQLEHRVLADRCAEELSKYFPSIAEHFEAK